MAPLGGAAKQRPRGRATRRTIARTEVRGPVHRGKTLSSIGYELVETPHRRILAKTLSEEPWRLTGARRSSGHVAGLSNGAERGGEKRQGIAHKRVAAERQVSRIARTVSHTVAPVIEAACQVVEKVYRVRAPDLLRLTGVGEFDEELTFVHPVLNGAAIGMAVKHLLRRCQVHQKSGSELQLSIIHFT